MTKIRVFALVLIVALAVFACKKTPKKVGTDLQPESSMITVAFTDASDIEACTENVSNVPSTNLYMLSLGNMNDSIFGISNFDFYTQLSLTTESQTWGTNAVADSVVLYLCYSGFYGDTTEYLNVKVYELEEAMLSDTTYRSNQNFDYDPTILADMSFTPRPLTAPDTILDRGVLRIPINPSLGNKFIENESHMTSNTNFKEFFKGLFVDCEKTNASGAICYYNPTHSYTYMRVYYHNDIDTLFYDFGISSTDVWVNHYAHDYTGHENIFEDNARYYLQGSAGTKVWLKFPNIKEWADAQEGYVVINEAKLILTGAVSDTAIYTPPASLILVGEKHDTDTTYVYLPDQYEGSNYFGGSYEAKEGIVWFRISQYIQKLVKNGTYQDLDGIYINVSGSSTVARRWAFYGNNEAAPDSLRLRLEVVYSLVNE
jgi:hypothetical protein